MCLLLSNCLESHEVQDQHGPTYFWISALALVQFLCPESGWLMCVSINLHWDQTQPVKSQQTLRSPPELWLYFWTVFFIFIFLFYCEIRQEVLVREILAQIQNGTTWYLHQGLSEVWPRCRAPPTSKEKNSQTTRRPERLHAWLALICSAVQNRSGLVPNILCAWMDSRFDLWCGAAALRVRRSFTAKVKVHK